MTIVCSFMQLDPLVADVIKRYFVKMRDLPYGQVLIAAGDWLRTLRGDCGMMPAE